MNHDHGEPCNDSMLIIVDVYSDFHIMIVVYCSSYMILLLLLFMMTILYCLSKYEPTPLMMYVFVVIRLRIAH